MADTEVGAKLTLDANQGIRSMKDFKKEIAEAKGDLIAMTQQFGATSKEAAAAAKKVADLTDEMDDAKKLVDAFNPDTKFRAFGASIQTVVGGFTALTGAMGLLGVESEEVQKTLLKVQSALALSQGISQLQEGIGAIKNLGSVLVQTFGKGGAIGIALAGLAAIGLAISGVFKKNEELVESQKEYNKAVVGARVEVAKIENAFKQAKLGIISKDDALKQYNTTMGQTVGEAKNLNEAEKLVAENADNYVEVQGLKAKANFLLAQSAKMSGEAELLRLQIESGEGMATFFQREGAAKMLADLEKRAGDIETRVNVINDKIKAESAGFNAPGGGKQLTRTKPEAVEAADFLTRWINDINLAAFVERQKLREIEAAEVERFNNEKLSKSSVAEQLETTMKRNNATARMAIDDAEKEAKLAQLQAVAGALSALSDLVGRQTAAGKGLGVAAAVINTYVGVTKALSAAPPPINFIQAAAVLFSGLAAVKNILAVKVPGGATTGNIPSSGAVSAPLQAQLPNSTNTRLDRDQLNQIGNAAVRAFVVESDVANNQERIRRLNRAARL